MHAPVSAGAPFELKGFWWDAADGEQATPCFGSLTYEPNTTGICLELVEWQGLLRTALASDIAVIFGQTLDGVPCTVFDALGVNRESRLPGGHSRAELRSSLMAYGAWLRDPEEFPVRQVTITWRGLNEWLAASWRGPSGKSTGLSRDEPAIKISLADGAVLTLGFNPRSTTAAFEEKQEWIASLTVETPNPIPFGEIRQRYLVPFHDLVLFGTTEETVTQSLTLPGLDVQESELIEEVHGSVEFIVQDASRPLTAKRNPYRHLLMPIAVWRSNPTALAEHWLGLHTKLGKTASLLFATLNSRPPYIENQLLNLTTFAESYHRTLHDESPITKEEHSASVTQMLTALPDKRLQDHYRPRLKYADEQSFRGRMKDLFRRAEGAVEGVKQWRTAGLPDDLIETRNSLTHRAGDDGNALEDADLFWATRRLLVVLQTNLMLDLHMPADAVAACITQRYEADPSLFSG